MFSLKFWAKLLPKNLLIWATKLWAWQQWTEVLGTVFNTQKITVNLYSLSVTWQESDSSVLLVSFENDKNFIAFWKCWTWKKGKLIIEVCWMATRIMSRRKEKFACCEKPIWMWKMTVKSYTKNTARNWNKWSEHEFNRILNKSTIRDNHFNGDFSIN